VVRSIILMLIAGQQRVLNRNNGVRNHRLIVLQVFAGNYFGQESIPAINVLP
jgi:hypothetical protein